MKVQDTTLTQPLIRRLRPAETTYSGLIVLSVATGLLVLVAFGAGFVPAHRASRVNPMEALRED